MYHGSNVSNHRPQGVMEAIPESMNIYIGRTVVHVS